MSAAQNRPHLRWRENTLNATEVVCLFLATRASLDKLGFRREMKAARNQAAND